MFDVERYLCQLIGLLKEKFASRLSYVGLQGSYLRGEATDCSDLDIMVVIDGLSAEDLLQYREIIRCLERFDLSCGFICSKSDLANWNPLEIWNLLHGTKDYYGSLRELVPAYTESDVRNFTKLSINNLYHEICHRYIHAEDNRNMAHLAGAYKSVFYILQAIYYLRQGTYIATKAELLSLLSGEDRAVLERAISLHHGTPHDFSECFELLFGWCQKTLLHI